MLSPTTIECNIEVIGRWNLFLCTYTLFIWSDWCLSKMQQSIIHLNIKFTQTLWKMSSNSARAEAPEFDAVMMAELRRVSSTHQSLQIEMEFEAVLHQVCQVMSPAFGDFANMTEIKKRLRTIKAQYDRFNMFINKPGVVFSRSANKVTVTRAYSARNQRRVSILDIVCSYL